MVILKTGLFQVDKVDKIGCGGLGGIFIGNSANHGDHVGTTVSDRDKIDVAKSMVLECAIKQETEKQNRQNEIVNKLQSLKKAFWY